MTSPATSTRRVPLVGLALGVLVLVVMLVFAVALPRLGDGGGHGGSAELPDTLPGGWTAIETLEPPSGAPEDYAEQQQKAVDYVSDVLASVYDGGTAFRAYTTEDFSSFIVVTVFDSEGGAFSPATGFSDPEALGVDQAPVELVRAGEAVCVVNNQTAQPGQESDPEALPLAVTCQLTEGGQTYQIGSQQLSLDDTVELLETVAGA